MTTSYTAAAELVRRVRLFAQTEPAWGDRIVYFTQPDERFDLTLVSQRVYGRRDEFLAVMAAAGLDSVQQPLAAQEIILPSAAQLARLKGLCGFVTNPYDRDDAQAADPLRAR